VVMDVDLQDPSELLPKMYEMVKNGTCDSVATRRSDRTGEPVIRSFLSENFYKFINKISKTQLVYGARDYRIMCRKMVDAVLQMSEYNRFSKGIFSWVGFKTEWLEYENVERSAGETKWSLRQRRGRLSGKAIFLYGTSRTHQSADSPLSHLSGKIPDCRTVSIQSVDLQRSVPGYPVGKSNSEGSAGNSHLHRVPDSKTAAFQPSADFLSPAAL
jgi:hypothetical protein